MECLGPIAWPRWRVRRRPSVVAKQRVEGSREEKSPITSVPRAVGCLSCPTQNRLWKGTPTKGIAKVTQLCPTLCNPMDSTAYQAPPSMKFFQARVLEWGAIAFSRLIFASYYFEGSDLLLFSSLYFFLWSSIKIPKKKVVQNLPEVLIQVLKKS